MSYIELKNTLLQEKKDLECRLEREKRKRKVEYTSRERLRERRKNMYNI